MKAKFNLVAAATVVAFGCTLALYLVLALGTCFVNWSWEYMDLEAWGAEGRILYVVFCVVLIGVVAAEACKMWIEHEKER